jgi:hypothetical protein
VDGKADGPLATCWAQRRQAAEPSFPRRAASQLRQLILKILRHLMIKMTAVDTPGGQLEAWTTGSSLKRLAAAYPVPGTQCPHPGLARSRGGFRFACC